jgi:hypothetical protein
MNIGIDLKEHKQKTRRLGREDANSPNLKRINLALQGGAPAALLQGECSIDSLKTNVSKSTASAPRVSER